MKRPTVEEVAAYVATREVKIDPAKFVDFYEANGWKQGRGKSIVDWKAAVRTWEHREPRKQELPGLRIKDPRRCSRCNGSLAGGSVMGVCFPCYQK